MKKKIFNNFGLKILALAFAFLLWLIVMNITDYSVTAHIDGIPVEQLNGDVLDELDKIYDVTKGDTVDIVIKGRRSVVDGLSANDFIATADLSTMSITNTVQIVVVPKSKSVDEEISITIVDNTMQLSLEEKVTVQLPITIVTEGNIDEKYAVGELVANPNIITVEGPKNTVSRINKAVITVNVEGKNKSIKDVFDIKLLDSYDEEVKSDKLKVSAEQATAEVNIYPKKTVNVMVAVNGEVEDGYMVKEIMYQPQTVVIAGEKEDLSEIKNIVIDDISIDGLTEDYQATINLQNYLPDGVIIAQDSDDVVVTVDVEKIYEKVIKPTSDNVALVGKNGQYKYEVVVSDDFSITARGLKEDVADLNATTIGIKVKCQNLYFGTNYGVEFTLDENENVEYDITGYIYVRVTNK